MREPTVSVVVPTFRRPQLLIRAVESVLQQTYTDFEVIIVDDNGRGTSYQETTSAIVVDQLRDDRIRYIANESGLGGGGARNVGIAASRGEFVAFLDDDEDWLPEKLEKQIFVYRNAATDLGVVDTGFFDIHEDGSVTEHYPEMEGWILDSLLDKAGRRAPKLSTMLCRKDALIKAGLFDIRFRARQDLDLYIRLARNVRFASVPELLARKRADADVRISGNVDSRIQGSALLYEKILNDLEKRRRAHAAYLFRHAALLSDAARIGEMRDTLRNARRAARYDPFILLPLYLKHRMRVHRRGKERSR